MSLRVYYQSASNKMKTLFFQLVLVTFYCMFHSYADDKSHHHHLRRSLAVDSSPKDLAQPEDGGASSSQTVKVASDTQGTIDARNYQRYGNNYHPGGYNHYVGYGNYHPYYHHYPDHPNYHYGYNHDY